VHHLKTDQVENKHLFYLEPTPQVSEVLGWGHVWYKSKDPFQHPCPQCPPRPRIYWWNNLGTAVDKASGQKAARLGFICHEQLWSNPFSFVVWTNILKLNIPKHW
jgi:hypothetical protein